MRCHMPMNTHIITIWILQHQLNDSITAKWSFSLLQSANKRRKTTTETQHVKLLPRWFFLLCFTRCFDGTRRGRRKSISQRTVQMQMSGDVNGGRKVYEATMREATTQWYKSGPGPETLLRCWIIFHSHRGRGWKSCFFFLLSYNATHTSKLEANAPLFTLDSESLSFCDSVSVLYCTAWHHEPRFTPTLYTAALP